MADIIELLERRDEQGLELLKEKYAGFCYAIIYHLLRDHEQTEEALNDVWLRIWNSIPPARPARIRAYLTRVSRNVAMDYYRYNHAERRSAIIIMLDELKECIPDPNWDERGRLREILQAFVNTLEPEVKQIFLRRYLYGNTIEELAKATHSTQNRITGILFRTRKKLRKFLEKEGYQV